MTMLRALCIALSTYSQIPVPQVEWNDKNMRYSLCFFPIIGLIIGVLCYGWLCLADKLALTPVLRGAVGALIPLLISGGIHMDGLMDTMDALASHADREKKLLILKDSHVGAFGALSAAGYLLLMAGVMSQVSGPVVLMAFVLSRALSALALVTLPCVSEGLLRMFRGNAASTAVMVSSSGYLLLFGALLLGMDKAAGGAALCILGLCLLWYRKMSVCEFGGITGDLAGWFVQIAEAAMLFVGAIVGRIL